MGQPAAAASGRPHRGRGRLAVATGIAGYLPSGLALPGAGCRADETASSVAFPVAQDIRNIGGLTGRALRAGNVSIAVIRADNTSFTYRTSAPTWSSGPTSWRSPGSQVGASHRTGVASNGEGYRIVAVPITDLGNYALVLGRPLEETNRILSSLCWC